jgi:hypothetical protein
MGPPVGLMFALCVQFVGARSAERWDLKRDLNKCFPENDKRVSKIHNLLILAPKIMK